MDKVSMDLKVFINYMHLELHVSFNIMDLPYYELTFEKLFTYFVFSSSLEPHFSYKVAIFHP